MARLDSRRPHLIREPAVAGQFYPDDPEALRRQVDDCMATVSALPQLSPKAIIAPHAGLIYSGPIAAHAYAALRGAADRIRRVIVLGPSHRVAFQGLALPDRDAFLTPLGSLTLDRQAMETSLALPQVLVLDSAHSLEHSIEVQLPFLQTVLNDIRIVPVAVGEAEPEEVAAVLDLLWGGDETLIVVSSDLSHFHDYRTAMRYDSETTKAIESLDERAIDPQHACGCRAVAGLLRVMRRRGLRAHTLDCRNSGDTAGDCRRVVGYGAWAFA